MFNLASLIHIHPANLFRGILCKCSARCCLLRSLRIVSTAVRTAENIPVYPCFLRKRWISLNNLCTILTVYICCIIEENNLIKEQDSLNIAHYLCEELHEVEPYNLEWITSTLGIYNINSPEMEAAYFYVYRNLYKTKFENKKNKYPQKNY